MPWTNISSGRGGGGGAVGLSFRHCKPHENINVSHKKVTTVEGCLSESQNVAPLKGEQFRHDTGFIWTQKETIIQQSTARWHFLPFLCGYFSYTQPLVVSTLMAKSICTLSWTIIMWIKNNFAIFTSSV